MKFWAPQNPFNSTHKINQEPDHFLSLPPQTKTPSPPLDYCWRPSKQTTNFQSRPLPSLACRVAQETLSQVSRIIAQPLKAHTAPVCVRVKPRRPGYLEDLPSNPFPLIHLVPAIFTFFVVEHSTHTSVSVLCICWPVSLAHFLSPVSMGLAPSLLLGFALISPHERLPQPPYVKKPSPPPSDSLAALFSVRYLPPPDVGRLLSSVSPHQSISSPPEQGLCLLFASVSLVPGTQKTGNPICWTNEWLKDMRR